MTGFVSRSKPLSGILGHPATETQASQSANVTSNLDAAKGLAIVTLCGGPSWSKRPGSVAGDPIVKVPAGTTIISGQSFAHSRKLACGFSARSTSGLSTYG